MEKTTLTIREAVILNMLGKEGEVAAYLQREFPKDAGAFPKSSVAKTFKRMEERGHIAKQKQQYAWYAPTFKRTRKGTAALKSFRNAAACAMKDS